MTPRKYIYTPHPDSFSSVVKMMSELGEMRPWQLKAALRERGLPASGNKILLVSRLEDAMSKDAALEMCLREAQEEEQEAFEWLNNQELNRKRAERHSRDLEEMETEVGNGSVGYVKQFAKKRITQERKVLKKLRDSRCIPRHRAESGDVPLLRDLEKMETEVGNGSAGDVVKKISKKRIDQERAVLKKLRDEDEKDRSKLIKLTANIEARNEVILCKEKALDNMKTAADLFISFFSV